MKETLKERSERYKQEGHVSAAFEAEQHLRTLKTNNMGKLLEEIHDFIKRNEDVYFGFGKGNYAFEYGQKKVIANDTDLEEKFKELKTEVSWNRNVDTLDIDNATQVEYVSYPVEAEPENNVKKGWDIDIYRVTLYSEALDIEQNLTNYDEEQIKDLIIKNLEK